MRKAADLLQADRAYLIHPLTRLGAHERMGATVYLQGIGAEVELLDGSRAIDATSGLWCVNIGHGRANLAEAARDQMSRIAFAPTFAGAASVPTIELAEKLAALTPPGLDASMFTSGGTEANESAFKLARLYWRLRGRNGKTIILSHDRAYHGLGIGSSAATGLAPYHVDFGPLGSGFEHFPSPYCYRCQPGDDCVHSECRVDTGAALVERIEEIGPESIAAVIVEPVLGTGGVIVPPDGYLRSVREICTRFGILLIADEVITGFGRTGRWFGVQREDVVPDMMTFAKGLTSGYLPLGAVTVSTEIWATLHELPGDRPLMHGFTYSGHPVACAVALENLRTIEQEDLVGAVAEKAVLLDEMLGQLRVLPHVGDVRQAGFMVGVELVADRATKRAFDASAGTAAAVVNEARQRGVLSRALLDDVVMLSPPFVTTPTQLERIVSVIGASIEAVTKIGVAATR